MMKRLYNLYCAGSKYKIINPLETYLALTLDMSGVLELTPGPVMVCVVSRLEAEVLILSLGRDKLPRLLLRPGVGGPGLV